MNQTNMKYIKLFENFKESAETVLLFGPQGVGKSTVARELAKGLGAQVIESDDSIKQGDWSQEPTWLEGWRVRKKNELPGMIAYLEKNLGKKAVLDIGGSHGVWEGAELEQILELIEPYPNRFLIIPSRDLDKSQAFLRKRVAGREASGEGEHAEAIRKHGPRFMEFMPDEPGQKFDWQPGKVQDYSRYFITQMLRSGIVEPDRVIYLDEVGDRSLAEVILDKIEEGR